MIAALDHVVILVDDLAQARADYTALGFTVLAGGVHAGGLTHNALVVFADGSYLELLAFLQIPDSGPAAAGISPLTRRWLVRRAGGEGLLDYALLPTAIAADLAAARAHGLAYAGPLPGGRRRPDGQEVAWELGIPQAPDLPFLCSDVTPRALRVPADAAREHANGAQGIAGIDVCVADLAASAARYSALLGRPGAGPPDGPAVLFPCGAARIGLLRDAAAADGDAVEVRPAALHLIGAPGSAAALDRRLAHGAAIGITPARQATP